MLLSLLMLNTKIFVYICDPINKGLLNSILTIKRMLQKKEIGNCSHNNNNNNMAFSPSPFNERKR